jgi:hypothetical protein
VDINNETILAVGQHAKALGDEVSAELLSLLESLWHLAKYFFDNQLLIAIFGAAAGAFFGANAAQRIAERGKIRDELLREIRNTNAAIMVSFSICNSLLGLKKQHVKSLKESFDTQKSAFLIHAEKRERGEQTDVFEYQANLRTLSLPPLPVDILQNQIFEKLSLMGRSLALATTLRQSVHGLSASLDARNNWIELSKTLDPEHEPLFVRYFGVPHRGRVNEEYSAFIEAIYSQTDEGIHFSEMLCNDLVEYGNTIVKKFEKRFGKKDVPAINKPVWDKAVEMMPKREDFADWDSMFLKMPKPSDQKK